MFVKICGLKTPESVAAAVDAGADAIGFVFAPNGPRTTDPESVAQLVTGLPGSVETVGVFRNQPIDEVLDVARRARVQTIQLHGAETLADLAAVKHAGFGVLRAFSAKGYTQLPVQERTLWDQERLLLDAVEPGAGQTFDTVLLRDDSPAGFWLLAGGLTPQNVATLAATLQPAGVDVSSGVESARGVKDVGLIRAFVAAAKSAAA